MDRIDPGNLLRRLGRSNVEVDDDRLLAAANEDAAESLVSAGVNLLVGHERRHVDEISGPGLSHELQAITPAHPGPATDDINHALEVPVVMGTRLRVGMNRHRSGP